MQIGTELSCQITFNEDGRINIIRRLIVEELILSEHGDEIICLVTPTFAAYKTYLNMPNYGTA